jgi:hypothetical protein
MEEVPAMRTLAIILGFRREPAQACLDGIRAARVAELEKLLAEIAAPPCPCPDGSGPA